MHLCFVDESGTPAKPGQEQPRHFVFGGLVIPEERWKQVRDQLIGLKTRLKYRGEVKWRYFAPQNKEPNNPMQKWSQEQRNHFRDSMFRIVTKDSSLRIIAGVCDAPLAYELPNVNRQEDIYFHTYKVVTERFQYFLQDLTKNSGHHTSGIIAADHRNIPEDQNMRVRHERGLSENQGCTHLPMGIS